MHEADMSTLGLFLLTACVVAIITRRIGFPYVVGLVLAGVGMNLSGYRSGWELTPDLIFTAFLPPLIFEAAIHLRWDQFRREAPLVLSLAFIGTFVSAAIVATGMHWLGHWGWQASLLFGSLIAATDPVSVIAMMKEQNAERRLRFVMESESLINDGAAAVLFALCMAAATGGHLSPGDIGLALLRTVAGGVVCGLLVAGAVLQIARRSDDRLVELTLTALVAYGSFALAEKLDVSPVLATLTAGMLVGNWGQGRHLTAGGSQAMKGFWDFAAFLANSIIFLLIGSRTAAQPWADVLRPVVIATSLALIGRAVAIYPIGALFSRTGLAMSLPMRNLLFWGGLRGALAAALALGVPESLPEHDALIGATFAVVAFSIFVQGMTVPRLLRKSGLLAPEA